MTIQIAGLLLICGLLFLISSLGFITRDLELDCDPGLSRQQRISKFYKRLMLALLTSKLFLLGIALLFYSFYFLFSQLYQLKSNADDIAQLQYKSHAHQVLIGFFIECRSERYTSNGSCVIKMKQFAEIEGLENEFEQVYSDLKHVQIK